MTRTTRSGAKTTTLYSYLSSVDSVLSTMRKLKKVWYNNGLVKIVQSTMGVNC
ncbi:hypothetical protein PGT21_025084 [Puccinia graminis f. sp. tritici]|uniref:Uncharacterized protein n=1 Tax=Puccinia graminis f. sp. tritici TaxID=56615 RepID=A0A5B0N2N0_PUCGR|nr:hypothetical protein PGT21_025084 [Puccinia graminis f. sp. tritici]KAA1100672.1 hypothetical protein PGTUg99_013778 [Puccinia graminis f. sp. tritici]KAA1123965.1 hypothetical protein PGTUg99_013207 [Puccinia graminis f. sp. tritici]